MKSPPKSPLAQLNLPLLDPVALPLPAGKDQQLMQALIELTTNPGHLVFDPFCGSGTTLVAARMLERHYLGVEINKEYHLAAKKRLHDLEKRL